MDGRFALRACIVNFHTSLDDIEALLPLVSRLGRQIDAALRREPAVEYTAPAGDAPAQNSKGASHDEYTRDTTIDTPRARRRARAPRRWRAGSSRASTR